jgi:hypothetical protein
VALRDAAQGVVEEPLPDGESIVLVRSIPEPATDSASQLQPSLRGETLA